jgi:ferric-dicitrate binding protein FerR (iron transport regulator)
MIHESELLRYIEGECTPEEAAAIQEWLASDPHRVELLEELRVVWRHTGRTVRHWEVARAREWLLRARGLSVPPAAAPPRRTRWMGWPAWSVAASVILALVASAAYLGSRPTFRTYETEPGQRLTLTLADGSRVLLSAASRLRVAHPFGARARVVELQGEAYFIVQHETRRPFLVRTGYGTAQDLGTEFDVREYPQDSAVQVVVASGQVVLRGRRTADSASHVLRANDRGVVGADGSVAVVNDVQLESYLAWIEGRLVFDQAPLRDIVTELERWYDLEIETRDMELGDERVTISFAHQTADQALSELATVVNARHARTDRRVQLVRDHSPQ